MSTILLLGQAPSSTSSRRPLDGRSGVKLADLAGIKGEDVADVFAVGNLLARFPGKKDGGGDAFPLDEARRNALAMLETMLEFDAIVLLGRNVGRVFGMEGMPYFQWMSGLRLQGWVVPVPACVMPHPSGVSRWWNEPSNVEQASAFMRGLLAKAVELRVVATLSGERRTNYHDGMLAAA